MKNKFILFLIFTLSLETNLIAQTFEFKTKNINIYDNGKKILAEYGKVISSDNDIEIESDKFEFDDNLKILNANGNGSGIIKSKNLTIEFDNIVFNKKKMTIDGSGNTKIQDLTNKLIITTNKFQYYKNSNIIKSNTKTLLEDSFSNKYFVDSFIYEIDKNLVKFVNLELYDNEGNSFKTPIAFINIKSGKLYGKDIFFDFNNSDFDQKNNPRMRGKSVMNDKFKTEITKGIFTTCQVRDGCPPWQFKSKKIIHDKQKKTINYNDAVLKIYDVPIFYFPKFYHPDPTVKRKSGFLTPSIKSSSNANNYLHLPYFFVLAENKDLTISPRFYDKSKFLIQSEYRQVNKNSNHIFDLSYLGENNNNSENHFFYNFKKNLRFNNFEDAEIKFSLQQVSNDTYLKINKLNSSSEIVKESDVLENSLDLDLFSNDMSLNINTSIYENLNETKNKKYEYISPLITISKQINNKTNFDGDILLQNKTLIRNYQANIYEKSNVNNLLFNSTPFKSNFGFYSYYEFLIKNHITESVNSTNMKNGKSAFLSSIFQYNSSLPVIKENEIYRKIIKPKISLKVSPEHTRDINKEEIRLDANNVFSLDRFTNDNVVEGGISLTYGTEYNHYSKEKSRDLLTLKFANNTRLKKNDDLPSLNQLNDKTSNFFNEILYQPSDFIKLKYENSIKNDLKHITFESLSSEFKINNFITKFDYQNENNTKNQNTFISNNTSYFFNESNSLSFSTRKDKSKNLTEYYDFIYQYKNDCLSASIEYNKDYYDDKDLKPSESIFFKLSIIPLGTTTSPNFRN